MNINASKTDKTANCKKRIYDAIFSRENGIERQELSAQLGISYPTVMQYTKLLLEEGYIQEYGQSCSTGGRKAVKFVATADIKTAVGVEITQTYISIVLVDMRGTLLYHERIYEPFFSSAEYCKHLARQIQRFLQESGCDKGKVLGCGIAIPGIVKSGEDISLHSNTLDLTGCNLLQLGDFLQLPCSFTNDANAAAHAEFGSKRDDALRFYLSLNNTVGGAVLHDGGLMLGANNTAGAFGHMCLIPNGAQCYCGRKGCVNAYCSAHTLAKETGGKLDVFFEELESGNPDVAKVWDAYLGHLALFANNLVMGFDYPVVLGGYVGGYMSEYMDAFCEKMRGHSATPSAIALVSPCQMQTKAASVGAALLHVEQFTNDLFL